MRVRGRDRAALRRGAGESPATGELLQESLSLLSPAAAYFCCEHDEAASPRLLELGVSGATLALGRLPQGEAKLRVSPWAAAAVTPEGAHKRDVNRDLDSSEGGKAMRPFATTSSRRPSETGTPRFKSRRATLVANERAGPGSPRWRKQRGGHRARQVPATTAQPRRQRQWESQSPQQDAAGDVVRHGKLFARWQGGENNTAVRPRLRQQQCPRRRIEVGK